jgi:hypothetical protein
MNVKQFDFETLNPYHLTFADYRNSPEVRVLASKIIAWLYRFSSFVEKGGVQRSKQFNPAYNKATSTTIINKEWASLIQYDLPYVSAYYTQAEEDRESLKFKATVETLKACIANLEKEFQDPKILAKDKGYALKKGQHTIESFKTNFHYRDNLYIRAFLSTCERFLFLKNAFDVCKIMESIDTYIELMDSLKNEEAMGKLGPTVAQLMENQDYFAKGYPKDIFCYDKRQLKMGLNDIEVIYAHKKRCTTFVSTTAEPLTVNDEFFKLFEPGSKTPVNLKEIA